MLVGGAVVTNGDNDRGPQGESGYSVTIEANGDEVDYQGEASRELLSLGGFSTARNVLVYVIF